MDYIVTSNAHSSENLVKLTSEKIHLYQPNEIVEKQISLSLTNKIYAPQENALDSINRCSSYQWDHPS